jgi:hypothetical protein
MHSSLTIRANAALLLLWCAVLVACFLASPPPSLFVLAPFFLGGLAAGLLQSKAMRGALTELKAAATSRQVRKVLLLSCSGKLSVLLLWCAGLAVLGLLLRGGITGSLQSVFSAYAAFSLAREAAALPAVFRLAQVE